MKYLQINVSVPVCETPSDVMDMLNSPKILKKVSRLITKVVGEEIVSEAMAHTRPTDTPVPEGPDHAVVRPTAKQRL